MAVATEKNKLDAASVRRLCDALYKLKRDIEVRNYFDNPSIDDDPETGPVAGK